MGFIPRIKGFILGIGAILVTLPSAALAAGDCLAPARDAARRHAVPAAIVEAMVLRESSNQPLAIGVAGRAVVAPDPGTAVRWIDHWRKQGVKDVSIDMGCMQVNRHFHPAAFDAPENAFDPVLNTEYGVRYLRTLFDRYRDWTRAAAAYNCSRVDCQITYLCGLIERMDRAEWQRQCVAPGHVAQKSRSKAPAAEPDLAQARRDQLRRQRDVGSRTAAGSGS